MIDKNCLHQDYLEFNLDSILLTGNFLGIEQIADAVGYQNKGYFYRIFAERHRMTPAKYRKTHGF